MAKSWIIRQKAVPGGWTEHPEAEIPVAPVVIDVQYSGLNYKDALSVTGKAPISRAFPMVPGIDIVGTVREDSSGTYRAGDRVVATGFGMGETRWGGYTTVARLEPEWLIKLPETITSRDAAAVGTAGITAALAIDALEAYGLPLSSGEILVSGATGGVGGFALRLMDAAGYHAVAMTSRVAESDYLLALGAKSIVDRSDFEQDTRPLAKERWIAGIDVAGGKILANMLSTTFYGGSVAACGLAASMELPTSVAPFILRGVNLLGIDSVMASREKRERAWSKIEALISARSLDDIVSEHKFDEVAFLARELLANERKGRVVLSW
jgi:acrylyl-CoA reductase (NADPH)